MPIISIRKTTLKMINFNFTRKAIWVKIIFFILGVGSSLLIHFILTWKQTPPEFREKRLKQNYLYINPLLECEVFNPTFSSTFKIKNMITDYISRERVEGKTSDISVYYRDLNNGPWFGINEKAYFAPASLNKVPLLIVTLKAAEKEPSILEQKIRVIDIEIYKEQNVQPEKKLKIGNEYSIYQLLEQMIVYSDNVAFDLVMNHIPYDTLEIIFKDLGIDVSQIYNQETTLTVKDYSSFFRILYNASYLSREMSETALKIMAKSTFQKGLVAGVPQSVKVSHKFGERAYKNSPERQFHDCGIIYHTDKPYLLCIMTKGNDFVNSYSVIKDISSMVYNFTSQ